MLVMPAVDLRDGACVQLVGGDYAREAVRWPDARAAAARWVAKGFRALHIVDLDAATGRGDNRALAATLAATPGVRETQAGGGVRDDARLAALLEAGATRVIVGTRALEDPAWLAAAAARHPGRIVVAADLRDDRVVTRGWQDALERPLADVFAQLDPLPLAAVLVTAVHREGLMQGPDLPLFQRVVALTRHAVQASGGITTIDDIRALDRLGVAAVVLGMSLYTGVLDARALTQEFET
jgi:phosphoribosylformimino-5-aminoimidazole carboxamide ribotide isomerase